MSENALRLTQMVSGGGCAAKLGPGDLRAAVSGLFSAEDKHPSVLVGFDTMDDAGVYRLDDETALVQTVDFITPVVDDPFAYGAIAAANALSDVYAMGGAPITGMNIVGFPAGGDTGLLRQILAGGYAKLREAGAALVGGHSISDPEIKYGVSVTGLVTPSRMITNAGAKVGDRLILTKALGTGVISSAIKLEHAPQEAVAAAIASMTTLNRAARDSMVEAGAHACTDVTGFSLIGHLGNLVRASGVTAALDLHAIPILPGAKELATLGIGPGGTMRNRNHYGQIVEGLSALSGVMSDLLFDPQTSGGLLIALAPHSVARFRAHADTNRVTWWEIGEVVEESDGRIMLR